MHLSPPASQSGLFDHTQHVKLSKELRKALDVSSRSFRDNLDKLRSGDELKIEPHRGLVTILNRD